MPGEKSVLLKTNTGGGGRSESFAGGGRRRGGFMGGGKQGNREASRETPRNHTTRGGKVKSDCKKREEQHHVGKKGS